MSTQNGSRLADLSVYDYHLDTIQSIKYIVFVQEKLSDEKLAERIERIKAQNEKIKQRRLVRMIFHWHLAL
jgi:hypothetical protein